MGNGQRKFSFLCEGIVWVMLIIIVANVPSIYSRMLRQYVLYDHFHRHFNFFSFVWSIFLVSILRGEGNAEKLLSIKPLRYLGSISFSIYGWH